MSSFAVIIAEGPNDVRVPCLIFQRLAEAKAYMEKFGLQSGTWQGFNWVESKDGLSYLVDEDWIEENSSHFFTDYYGGCGEVNSFTIEVVAPGEKFVGWDLD